MQGKDEDERLRGVPSRFFIIKAPLGKGGAIFDRMTVGGKSLRHKGRTPQELAKAVEGKVIVLNRSIIDPAVAAHLCKILNTHDERAATASAVAA